MITAEAAYLNMINHQKRSPIREIDTVYEMIRVSSTLGFERIEIFVLVKDEKKFKTKLNKLGFLVNKTYAASLPGEVLFQISWNTSYFVGETVKELKGE